MQVDQLEGMVNDMFPDHVKRVLMGSAPSRPGNVTAPAHRESLSRCASSPPTAARGSSQGGTISCPQCFSSGSLSLSRADTFDSVAPSRRMSNLGNSFAGYISLPWVCSSSQQQGKCLQADMVKNPLVGPIPGARASIDICRPVQRLVLRQEVSGCMGWCGVLGC